MLMQERSARDGFIKRDKASTTTGSFIFPFFSNVHAFRNKSGHIYATRHSLKLHLFLRSGSCAVLSCGRIRYNALKIVLHLHPQIIQDAYAPSLSSAVLDRKTLFAQATHGTYF